MAKSPKSNSTGRGHTTPMMRQYLELKERYPDSLLFFRLGDFYEMFFEDAQIASRILEITLTSRDKGEDPIPMCGVPHHAARGYIARLVERGYKVAVAEQTEDPKEAKTIVARDVIQVVTPGLVTDLEMIEAKDPHYLLGVAPGRKRFGFAYVDVTTGEFRAGQAWNAQELVDEISRIDPKEIVVDEGWSLDAVGEGLLAPYGVITKLPSNEFARKKSLNRLKRHLGTKDLTGYGVDETSEGVRAAGGVLGYVELNHKGALANIRKLAPHVATDVLSLGETTKKNLEVFHTLSGARGQGTLFGLMDRTRTPMGGRALRAALSYPMTDTTAIESRLEAVGELVRRGDTRRKVREKLKSVGDLERLAGKVVMNSANGRDIIALKKSIAALPVFTDLLESAESPVLSALVKGLPDLDQLTGYLENAISDDPPIAITEGGIIRDGFSAELDELRMTQSDGRGWIAELQASERERTNISTLKVGFNKVFGYYIEVSRAKLDLVPKEYLRRQTLANAERFITPELKEMEEKVLGADERARILEYELFCVVRDEVAGYLDQLQSAAMGLAALDLISGLSELAVENRYARPRVTTDYGLEIVGGRHPVVEKMLTEEEFVPNDISFDTETNRLIIVTGPNMSGKSTTLRQTALIILMAQMGSFVPAESALIGVADKIFTRVGASDDLARGRSTFMVEMTETANILNNASDRSFIILDEIGRGTSTFDGLSIAWAVAEHLHGVGARTLFATHYHELTDLAKTLKGVANYNVAVKEWAGEVVFLRRLVEGGVNRSYGIHVGKLAGLPEAVLERAGEVLENLEAAELDETGVPRLALSEKISPEVVNRQLNLFRGATDVRREKLLAELSGETIDTLTPVEALIRLESFKRKAADILGGGGKK